jgi:ATP phosphoribosyltransferase
MKGNTMNLIEDIKSAERILIPDDSNPAWAKALEGISGIGLPSFAPDAREAISEGRTFIKASAREIPRYLVEGLADAGLTGTDSCVEYEATLAIDYMNIGLAIRRFSLLAEPQKVNNVKRKLNGDQRYAQPLCPIPTSMPRLLKAISMGSQGIPFVSIEGQPAIDVPAVMRSSGIGIGADLVSLGETVRSDGLTEVFNMRDIYPAIVMRRDS